MYIGQGHSRIAYSVFRLVLNQNTEVLHVHTITNSEYMFYFYRRTITRLYNAVLVRDRDRVSYTCYLHVYYKALRTTVAI